MSHGTLMSFLRTGLSKSRWDIFLLTGISNKNIFFIKKKINVDCVSNIHDKFPSTNLTWNLKKRVKNTHYNFLLNCSLNNGFLVEMVEYVRPFPGAGKKHTFPLLPPCPPWRSCKSSFCGEAWNQKASCVCWCCCCRQSHGHSAAQSCAG